MTQLNLQDTLLNQVRREQIEVQVHLLNGDELKGRVKGFDNFTIILNANEQQKMIYKHAIAYVAPSRSVPLGPPNRHMV